MAGVTAAPVLLTAPACMSAQAGEALTSLASTVIAVLGGTGAVKNDALSNGC